MKLLNKVCVYLKKSKFNLLFPIVFICIFSFECEAQKNSDIDDISIIVQIDGVKNTFNIAALYSQDEKLYISVEELFQVLIIPCIISNNGDLLNGFIENEKRLYEINFLSKQIKDDLKIFTLSDDEIIKNMGMIYLESSAFEKIFGIHVVFNFRSLSIKVTSDFELPILKKQRLEKSRNSIRSTAEEFKADRILKRDYHLFRFGNLDWSLMSTQTPGNPVESRFGLNLGAEILCGEVNAYLNFSDKFKPDPRQQQFYWLWVDNEKKGIRQIQTGNISSNTISSLNAPVHGAVITNTPTTIRKARGEYTISDVTQPDWLIELYINNALIDYTKADAAGRFTFKVPIVYGYTVLKLKFYGPMGQERMEERVMNVPSNFMPAGVFEYKLSGGVLQDDLNSNLGRGEGNYGITRNFTIGGGVEYLSSIKNLSSIPFVSFSLLPVSKLILTGEYAHNVRSKALLNYYLWSNAMFEIDYTKYTAGQKAILFNYLEERKIGLSIPMHFNRVSGSTRISYKQNVFQDFNYNMVDLIFSAFYKQFSANLSTFANWISDKPTYINANTALSVRLPKGYSFRPSAQFNISNAEIISFKGELEKKVSKAGYCSFSYERNFLSNYNSLNVSFKYDLSFAQANISVRAINSDISLLESVRGGIIVDDHNNRIFASQQSMVGRGGIAFIPFVDVNHNDKFDPGERKADWLSVKINGGRAMFSQKDSIVRVMGLEPFIYYNVELDDKDFEFITWRLLKKSYSILVDPNQIKNVEIPISPVAEITGNVIFNSDSTQEGLGRVLVNVFNKDGSIAANIITESDGYLDYLGLLPGEYYAKIDSVQLIRLNMNAVPSQVNFAIKAFEEGDVFNGIDFVLSHNKAKIKLKDDHSMILINPKTNMDSIAVLTQNSDTLSGITDNKITDSSNQSNEIDSNSFKTKDTLLLLNDSSNLNINKDTIGENIRNELTVNDNILISGNISILKNNYYIQCGGFKSKNNAMQLASKIKQNTDETIGIVMNNGLFKVQIGCFTNKADATELMRKLLEKKVCMSMFITIRK